VGELHREFGSHTSADVRGFDFAASYGDVMAGIHATSFVNSQRDPKQHPKPIHLGFPWPDEKQRAVRDSEVTPEERAALKAKLARFSGLRPAQP